MSDGPILFCYDGSEGAVRVFDAAAALLSGRKAVVADIWPVATGAEDLGVPPGGGVPLFQAMNLDEALARAREGAELARRSGFDAEPRGELAARTWQGICDLADELDASVIAIGSRGLQGLRELLEGSVSRAVVEHSRRPVLIVPPPGG